VALFEETSGCEGNYREDPIEALMLLGMQQPLKNKHIFLVLIGTPSYYI
jgi:hypothetical protein